MMWEHWLVQESLEMAVVLLAKSNLTDTDRTRWGQGRMEVEIVAKGQRRHSRQNFLSTIVQIRIISSALNLKQYHGSGLVCTERTVFKKVMKAIKHRNIGTWF